MRQPEIFGLSTFLKFRKSRIPAVKNFRVQSPCFEVQNFPKKPKNFSENNRNFHLSRNFQFKSNFFCMKSKISIISWMHCLNCWNYDFFDWLKKSEFCYFVGIFDLFSDLFLDLRKRLSFRLPNKKYTKNTLKILY